MRDKRDFLRSDHGLHRYLMSQIGQPWNKVYSNVCSMAGRGELGHRIRQRIEWNVVHDVYFGSDGDVYNYNSNYPIYNSFYIHPDTGVLCHHKRKTLDYTDPRPWEREINYFSVIPGRWMQLDEHGNWYEHWIEEVQHGYKETKYNPETKKYEFTGAVKYHIVRVEHKRELNHKEIVKLKQSPLFLKYGTNKNLYARTGRYIPAYKWNKKA